MLKRVRGATLCMRGKKQTSPPSSAAVLCGETEADNSREDGCVVSRMSRACCRRKCGGICKTPGQTYSPGCVSPTGRGRRLGAEVSALARHRSDAKAGLVHYPRLSLCQTSGSSAAGESFEKKTKAISTAPPMYCMNEYMQSVPALQSPSVSSSTL